MKALRFLGNAKAVIEEAEMPVSKPGEVMIKVAVSALCGSERSDYQNGCSFISGHEFAGEVVENKGCHKVKPGDRVAVNVIKGCGSCYYCKTGSPQFCKEFYVYQGGHAEFAVVPEECCLLLPKEMSYETGVLAGGDTLGVAYRAVLKLKSDYGRAALVLGAGPIGIGVISFLKYMGFYVIVSEPNAYRRNFAKDAAEADEVLNPLEENLYKSLERLTNGLGADVVFECSGNEKGQNQALRSVKPQGTVVFCGENYKGLTIVPSDDIIHKEITLTGAFYFTKNDFHGLCELSQRGFDPARLVSHRYTLWQAPEAFEQFFSGNTGKVLLCR